MNLAPVELKRRRALLQFEITRKKVPRKELMHFSRQMAVFMKAGIPVLEALEVMNEESGNKVLQRVMAEMADSLRAGETFAGAAAQHPEAFPPYYLGILGSAELTGNLDTVLDQLAEYIDRDIEARRKVSDALMYPGIVFVLAIIAVTVITAFVLPRFKTFFASAERQASPADADAARRRKLLHQRLVHRGRGRHSHHHGGDSRDHDHIGGAIDP